MVTAWPLPFLSCEKSPFFHASIGTVAVGLVPFRAYVICSLKKKKVLFRPS